MLRASKMVVSLGSASIPQSKLSVDGYSSNLKLKTGKYVNVKKRVHIDVDLAMGLSAVEKSVIGPGIDNLN